MVIGQLEPRLSIRPAYAFDNFFQRTIEMLPDTASRPTRASLAPDRPACALLLGEVFNLACDRHTQSASIMGFAPSRVLMDNLG